MTWTLRRRPRFGQDQVEKMLAAHSIEVTDTQRDFLVRWLMTRADGYRQDAHHMEYAKPGEATKLRSDSISPKLRRAIADELDQLATEIGRA